MQNLNEIIGLDTLPVLVKSDGTIIENINDQSVPAYGDCADFLREVTSGVHGWTAVDGFSAQSGYSGPVMHESEVIGGGLEKHIRENPGYYAAEVVYSDEDEENEPAGWVLLHKPVEG